MTWSPDIRKFVSDHLADDTARLLLSAHRYPTIDVPFAVEQIEARRRIRTKLPEWYALPDLIMSGRLPAEQCSSELTARFKRSLLSKDARSLCDMTGGMGVDFWYMSQGLERAVYTERQPSLVEAARHNFSVLSDACPSDASLKPCAAIECREGVSTDMPIPDVDVIYLDPARRSTDGSRIFEISDCEPDVVAWQKELLSHCRQLITKVSPMADISRTISRLINVSDIYVLSVRNECKELLIVQQSPDIVKEQNSDRQDETTDSLSIGRQIHCIDFMPSRTISFDFLLDDYTTSCSIPIAASISSYFYEPDVSIMKAQGFAALAARFDVQMLAPDCHYFTSDKLFEDFPGRVFVIEEQIPFSSRTLKSLRNKMPKANIAVRNFPMTADQLRAKTGIRDGGDVYLFGATLQGVGSLLVRCHKVFS